MSVTGKLRASSRLTVRLRALPRGGTGPQGAQGDVGPANSLSVGTVTTGVAGSSASASITGTPPNQVLSLTIPRGNTGETGSAGATGAAASIAVGTVTTGAPGSSATVTNVGTSAAAVFDFSIPKGVDGAGTGDMLKTENLSGLANYATARSNLGLAIGTNVQAYAANLTSWASLATSAKQDASANLDAWSAIATSTKAPATSGTSVLKGDGSGGFANATLADVGLDAAITSVASASTANIGAAATWRVLITGTTTITSFGSTTNALRMVTFEGALTLTHNATSLILPGGANIITAAGDTAIFGSDASGNWRCLSYTRAAGVPLTSADLATAAEFQAGTATKALKNDQVWSAMAETALTDGTNISVDMSSGVNFSVTLGGNRTLSNPSNTTVGKSGHIKVTQDGTGSRTLAYGTYYKFSGGTAPTLTTTASAVDYLFYKVISSTFILISPVKDAK